VSGARFLASFDIEDWFHAENLKEYLPAGDWESLDPRVERNTHALLDILAEVDARSTFFVLGWIARRYPGLVRRMTAEGHEVASHSDVHRRLYQLSPDELAADLARARDSLEQITGTRVWGLRAPVFSIDERVLDCLAAAGYWYDSSFYAFGAHDRYGALRSVRDPDQPIVPVRPGLMELPMSRLVLGPVALPWSGGGYFRLIPYPLFRWGVRRRLASRDWFLFYFHPWELDADETPPPRLPARRRFRAYVGRSRMRRDLKRLLAEFGSTRIDEALRAAGHAPPN
jgi:polysaccharide deacetylase family protein (PEP-CTERM system associated)